MDTRSLGSWVNGHTVPRFVGLEDAAGGIGSAGVHTTVPDGLTGEVVLDLEPVVARAHGDRQQGVHCGDLLDLLLEEPQHELLTESVLLGPGRPEKCLD